jgi:hypothetical protein
MTCPVICGRAEVGVIVLTPVPDILKLIVSAPACPLASVIAWRSEPAPELLVLVTL